MAAKVYSLCIVCGGEKEGPLDICRACSFAPTTAEEKGKSLYLSMLHRNEYDDLFFTKNQLEDIGIAIKGGESYQFDHRELSRLIGIAQDMEGVTVLAVIKAFVKVAWPGILFLLGLFGAIYFIR